MARERARTARALSTDEASYRELLGVLGVELFTNIGRADTLGSGTRNLFKYSWAYGGAQPVPTEGDVFEASVPILKGTASAMGASFDVDEVIFQMMRDYGYATVPGVAAIADVSERTVRRHISPLVADGMYGVSIPQNKYRSGLERLSAPDNSVEYAADRFMAQSSSFWPSNHSSKQAGQSA